MQADCPRARLFPWLTVISLDVLPSPTACLGGGKRARGYHFTLTYCIHGDSSVLRRCCVLCFSVFGAFPGPLISPADSGMGEPGGRGTVARPQGLCGAPPMAPKHRWRVETRSQRCQGPRWEGMWGSRDTGSKLCRTLEHASQGHQRVPVEGLTCGMDCAARL